MSIYSRLRRRIGQTFVIGTRRFHVCGVNRYHAVVQCVDEKNRFETLSHTVFDRLVTIGVRVTLMCAILLTGCEMLVPPVPIIPTPSEDTPVVPDQVVDTRCNCGCNSSSCDCNKGDVVAAAPIKLDRPIVTMLTDFESGCPACDAAWAEWQRDGDSWPFILRVERPNRLGGTSPTFAWQSKRGERIIWRPQFWRGHAELLTQWQQSQ